MPFDVFALYLHLKDTFLYFRTINQIMSEQKRVYTFGNGKAEGNAKMREQLGGKGANLAEMNLIGVPVPPGFTITTDCCNEYYEVGQEKIKAILENLRANPISSLADAKVIESRDYLNDIVITENGDKKPTGLPKSNVLYYVLENDQWCCVRPSGTEPKIKFYFGIRGKSMEDAKDLYAKFDKEIRKLGV